MADPSSEPVLAPVSAAVAQLAEIVLSSYTLEGVLERATVIAAGVIPGADEVSVTIARGRAGTAGASGPMARAADSGQYATGHGPCLDAARTGQTVSVPDVAREDRWPGFDTAAAQAGVGSSLSVPVLADQRPVGAFNVYARLPGAFGEAAVAVAEQLAGYASVVLDNASLYLSTVSRADQLAEALTSRAVIEQAKGILMAAHRVGPDEAFDELVRRSQRTHRKLRAVAQDLVERTVSAG